jgi:integrase
MARRKKNDHQELLALPHVHERDGRAFVRIWYQDSGGKWKSKERRVETVEEAIATISKIKRELGLRGPDAFDGEKMTFNDLLDQFIIDNPKMPDWYSSPLREYFANRRIITIAYADLKRFKAAREAVKKEVRDPADHEKKIEVSRKPSTINRELEWLRAVLLYAVRRKWIANNPFAEGDQTLISKTEEQTRDRVPTPEEEARILAVCVDERKHLRAILIAARDTGLRKSALLSLSWSNVIFRIEDEKEVVGDFLRVPEGNKYKKRPKLIALTARLRSEMQALWEKPEKVEGSEEPRIRKKEPNEKIFGGIKDVKRSYNTACRMAGVTDLHFHDWRHAFATDLMEAGVEERLAMRAAGHTSADTHAIYTNVDERLALHIAGRLDELHRSRQGGEAVTASELIN